MGRIINAFGANFAHGHDTSKRGVAYYGDANQWVTSETAVGNANDWLVMCCKGPGQGQAPRNVLVHGQAAGVRDTQSMGSLQLAINTGQSTSVSDWAFSHAIVWDQVLSDEEMAIVSSIMMKSLTDSSINIATMAACSCTGSVFCAKQTWGRWHAVNWDAANNLWRDSSSNNRHTITTEGTIQVAKAIIGDGARVPQTYLYGDVNAKLLFPPGSIPHSFTLCVMARYNGANKNRIFNSPTTDFMYGHWGSQRGRVYWSSLGWVSEDQISGPLTDWVIVCSKNPGTFPNNIIVNGALRGKSSTNFVANWQLSINRPNEQSEWAVAHAMVWDTALTNSELSDVSTAWVNSLYNSSIQLATLGTPSTCNCSVAWPACSGLSAGTQIPCAACGKCKPGRYRAPACDSGCMACPHGTYSSVGGESACTLCPAGSFSMMGGASACMACNAGKYYPFTGSSLCLDVSSFKYVFWHYREIIFFITLKNKVCHL
jgi:hypothetical protein